MRALVNFKKQYVSHIHYTTGVLFKRHHTKTIVVPNDLMPATVSKHKNGKVWVSWDNGNSCASYPSQLNIFPTGDI